MGSYHKVLSIALATADADGISLSQTPGAAGNLTITGALASGGVATLDSARRVLVTAAADEHTKTLTIYGTDRAGNVQSEVMTGPNATTGYTVLDFKTVTRVAVSAAFTGAVTVGTNDIASSAVFIVDRFISAANISAAVDITGTENVSIEVSYDDLAPDWNLLTPTAAKWFAPPNTALLTAITADAANYILMPVTMVRLTQNSGSGSVTATINVPMGFVG